MTLHTPRRRISPRTKRRVHAIRNFLKRALGSSSQYIKINSSIAVNVTDLKHKLGGFEHNIGEGNCKLHNKSCPLHGHHVAETKESKETTSSREESKETNSSRELTRKKTTVLYRSETNCESSTKCSEEDFKPTFSEILKEEEEDPKPLNNESNKHRHRRRHVNSSYHKREKRATQSTSQKLSTKHDRHDSRNHLHKHRSNPGRIRHRKQTDNLQDTELNAVDPVDVKVQYTRAYPADDRFHSTYPKRHARKIKNKQDLDKDFITEIIKRQYKPTRVIGHQSDVSQFSVPVCRDPDKPGQEYAPDIYSYYVDRKGTCKYRKNSLCDMRSVCDTRLYSHDRRSKHRHSKPVDMYNDERHYDIVPVKEKSSPKTRRKLVGDHCDESDYYKEVPPSPRTQRPQLNLKSQYNEQYEDYGIKVKHKRSLRKSRKKEYTTEETTDLSMSENFLRKKPNSQKNLNRKELPKLVRNEQVCTSSSLHTPRCPNIASFIANNENVDRSHDTSINLDKTDRTLNEIKDILQSFLQEIKKENFATQTSGNKLETQNVVTDSAKKNSTLTNSNAASFNDTIPNSNTANFSKGMTPQCSVAPPYVAPFANPCCYPVFPMCPMMQNGYLVPTPSRTNACSCTCGAKLLEEQYQTNVNNKAASTEKVKDETDELIKQIHKLVSENPKTFGKPNASVVFKEKSKLTSRSVGSHASNHDAKVGTPNMRYISRSCEALGSRYMPDTYYTNNSYSDTVLERLSLQTSNTISEESESESSIEEIQKTKSRFTRVLQTLGLKKKKKNKIPDNESDVEDCDSETMTEVQRKRSAPFKQNIQNYAVYGQEYFNRPPYLQHEGRPPEPHYIYEDHRKQNYIPPTYDDYPRKMRHETIYEENLEPTAPPYPGPIGYEHHQPYGHVPYCFKEVEVKSTATQSDRKISFFKKLSQIKPPTPPSSSQHTATTTTTQSDSSGQTAQKTQIGARPVTAAGGEEKIGFWKALILKAERDLAQQDVKFYSNPTSYGLGKNKMMAEGKKNGVRETFINKMLKNKNPFSPRNQLIKSVLGQQNNFKLGQSTFNAKPKMWF